MNRIAEFARKIDADFGADKTGGTGDEESFGHVIRKSKKEFSQTKPGGGDQRILGMRASSFASAEPR
jgi:hypothetical protein